MMRAREKTLFGAVVAFVVGVCITLANAQYGGFSGGIGGPGINSPPAVSSACSEANSYIARTSGIDGTHVAAYNTLICRLVTDGVWAKLDVLYTFATQDSTTALLNLVSSSFNASIGAATVNFVADRGYTSDGFTGYITTGFTPSTAGGNYTQNSASYGVYDRTNSTDAGAFQIGTNSVISTINAALSTSIVANISQARANTGNGDFVNLAGADVSGMYIMSRTASNAYKLYRYGNSTATTTDTAASTGNPSQPFFILASNVNGTPSLNSVHQIASAFIGRALNDTEAGNLQTHINAFMTTVGANVY